MPIHVAADVEDWGVKQSVLGVVVARAGDVGFLIGQVAATWGRSAGVQSLCQRPHKSFASTSSAHDRQQLRYPLHDLQLRSRLSINCTSLFRSPVAIIHCVLDRPSRSFSSPSTALSALGDVPNLRISQPWRCQTCPSMCPSTTQMPIQNGGLIRASCTALLG